MTGHRHGYTVHSDVALDVPVGRWPPIAEGAIFAINRALRLALTTGHPHEVRRPDGRILARYAADGTRTDLAPLAAEPGEPGE